MSTEKILNIDNLKDVNEAAVAGKANPVSTGYQIVHMGIGAFHRAHQAVYTHIANQQSDTHWSIVGVSLRSKKVRDTLAQQDYLYSVMEKSMDESRLRIISCVDNILVGVDDADDIIEAINDKKTKIITVTVTEKGYCQKDQLLDELHPNIVKDLKTGSPSTMPAFIAHALFARMRRGMDGLTIVSCDNLPNNGDILKNVVKGFADNIDVSLRDWIDDNVAFCSTMVDRIVPAVTEDVVSSVSAQLGLQDNAALLCEPYRQWVIEDNFLSSRPRWELAGALLVNDVSVYEKLKLRMLNGCHSAIAYIGSLRGDCCIHDTMSSPLVESFIKQLMKKELGASLNVPAGIDIQEYRDVIINRFKNKYVPYLNTQVATDGSLKLPQRLLFSACDLRDYGCPPSLIAFAVAAWIAYLTDYQINARYLVADPNLLLLVEIIKTHADDDIALVKSFISDSEVFPVSLVKDVVFECLVLKHYTNIQSLGVDMAIVEALKS